MQDMETSSMSIGRGMGKEDAVYIYTMEYDSAIKKEQNYVLAATWMQLEIIKAMVFPVVMFGCESWTIKKAEH